jgi:hypothetical protein
VAIVRTVVLHAWSAGPLALDTAMTVLLVGLVIVAAVIYDAYRQYGA